jgi:uncharacterized protein DUF6627
MKSPWIRTLCRLLVALMIWTPYHFAQAGMIGTDQVVQSNSQADRTTVLNFLSRSDVASQLQAYGIDPSTAKDRVAALSDQEAQSLAAQISTAPAGAISDAGAVILLVIIVVAVWWLWKRM